MMFYDTVCVQESPRLCADVTLFMCRKAPVCVFISLFLCAEAPVCVFTKHLSWQLFVRLYCFSCDLFQCH